MQEEIRESCPTHAALFTGSVFAAKFNLTLIELATVEAVRYNVRDQEQNIYFSVLRPSSLQHLWHDPRIEH